MRTCGGLLYAFLSTLMCIPGPLFAMQREGTPPALSLPSAAEDSKPPIFRGPPRNPPSPGLPGSQPGQGAPTLPRQPSLSLPLARSGMILASPDSVAYAAPTRTLSRSAP